MDKLSKYNFDESFRSHIIPMDKQKTKLETVDILDEEQEKSFREPPELVTLLPGLNLWRFCSQKNRPKFSHCWIDPKTMSSIMTTLRTGQVYGINHKKEMIRNSLAIKEEWSKLGYRVKIELKKSIIAYIGMIEVQDVFIDVKDKVYFGKASTALMGKSPTVEQLVERRKGGLVQIVIPRLRNRLLNQRENEFGKVVHFSPI